MQRPEWLDHSSNNGYTYYFKIDNKFKIMHFSVDLNDGTCDISIKERKKLPIEIKCWNEPMVNKYDAAIIKYTSKYKWLKTFYSKDKSVVHVYRNNIIYKIGEDGILRKDPNSKITLWNQPKNK